MQTFLPYPDFKLSASVLDNKRLGKQRVEAWQIYLALKPSSLSRWRNHPIVKMWQGSEFSLLHYGIAMCDEWIKRGFVDNLRNKFFAEIPKNLIGYQDPQWLGNKAFHASHRSNLLRKDSKHYGKFGWKEPNDLPYVWIK